jgi:hypothetical protein
MLDMIYTCCLLNAGALNNAAIRKYDLEAWFPGYNAYRELVSSSNCTDYQSRAMEIRCGNKKLGDTEKKYVHMLNATLCATGRGICCLLENYQEADGVRVPEVLVPFMGGMTFLPFVRESRNAPVAIPTQVSSKKEKESKKAEKKETPAPASTAPVEAIAVVTTASTVVDTAPKAKEAEKAVAVVSTGNAEVDALNVAIGVKGEEVRSAKAAKVRKLE